MKRAAIQAAKEEICGENFFRSELSAIFALHLKRLTPENKGFGV